LPGAAVTWWSSAALSSRPYTWRPCPDTPWRPGVPARLGWLPRTGPG